ncbi:MAG: MFS transporter [Chromatiales bacterium]|jgi:MFS family permease|nr:MFS transporter [Chromatiales bacterium]
MALFPGRAALASRDFGLYLAARFLAALAVQVQNVAVGWLVYDLTRSPFALGLVGLAEFLPAIALALVTGHAADRYDRRRILVGCYATTAAVSAGLLLFALSRPAGTWPVYALLVAFGTSRAFANPAGQALVPNLVPQAQLANAVAWNAMVWQTATIAGPAVGGLLYYAGPEVAFGTATAAFTACVLLFAAIRRRPQPAGAPANWDTLLAGVRFIRSRPAIFGAISLDLFAVLLGGATALLPIYARDILDVGPGGLGLLRSMPAVGALGTALWLAVRPLRRHSGRRMFQSVALFGAFTVAFGLSTNLWLSCALLVGLGAADMVSVYIRQTLVQWDTPDAMRGRVAAVNSVFIGASNELGQFESGTVAALIGAVPAVVVGGIGTMLVVGLWRRWFPALRDRDWLTTPAPGTGH